MLNKIKSIIEEAFSAEEPTQEDRDHALRLATAALLVETARADFQERMVETQAIEQLVQQHFALSDDEASELVEAAEGRADHAVSLHEFTRLLHAHLSAEEKLKVVEMLWRVAMADARLDRHEDHLVRKVADLLYVPRSDMLRLRHHIVSETKRPE